MENIREKLKKIIKEKALLKDLAVNLSSEEKSNYYFDIKQVSMRKEARKLIATLIGKMIKGDNITVVGGIATGAIPIIDTIIDFCDVEYGFYVRKKRKEHGLEKYIEGVLESGDRVLVVDDVSTKGNSIIECIKAIEDKNIKIVKVLTIVDRLEGASENLLKIG